MYYDLFDESINMLVFLMTWSYLNLIAKKYLEFRQSNYIIHVYCCCKTAKSTVMQSKKSLPCRSIFLTPEPHNQVLFRWRRAWRSLKFFFLLKFVENFI
jgi:hypothetical protein